MKYKSRKGTVINIPDGLSKKQIAAIKADADAGYGTRAQATANKLGKALAGNSATPTPNTTEAAPAGTGVVNKEDGTVDPVKAIASVGKAENTDVETNFNLEHPSKITDQYGNSRTIIRHADGTVTVTDEAGGTAKKFKDLAEAAASTFNGEVSRQKAYDAEFGKRTQYLDRNMSREEEEAKQELANRGIAYDPAAVYDPNTKNLYGKTIGGIKENYAGQYRSASDDATLAGNQAYATDANARDSFINAVTTGATTFGGNFGQYANNTTTDSSGDQKDLISLSSAAFLAKYGMDKNAYIQQQQINKQGSGGGGGGGGDSSGGFEILG